MERLGIHTADLGLPGAGPRARADILALCREIADHRMRITPNCAVRTVIADITPLVEISQKAGMAVEACAFIGSSPIRQFAEEWSLDHMLRAHRGGDLLRGRPWPAGDVRHRGHHAAPRPRRSAGSTGRRSRPARSRVCVCDTVGHITPRGVRNLVPFVRQLDPRDRRGRQDRLARPQRPRPRRDQHHHRGRPPASTASTRPRSASASGWATARWTSSSSTSG